MANAGRMEWDLMELNTGDVEIPERNRHLMDLGDNCASVPKARTDGFADTCHRYGVLPGYGATLLVVNRSRFGDRAPSSWADFFNPAQFPGPRSLPNQGDPWRVLIGALIADGVPRNALFPLDLDRAFRRLEQIRPSIALWWRSGDQFQQAFRQGEVIAALSWNTRIEFLRREGVPVQRVWDGATLNVAHWSVLRGAPNASNALRFLNWYFDHPEVQVAFGRAAAVSPATRSALALLPPEEQREQPGFPENRARIVDVDYGWIAANNELIIRRWNEWIAR
jgi:mannopine transport system substrate-binding protein